MKIHGYYTTEEAASELGLKSKRRVEQLLGEYEIQYETVGRAILIPEAEIERMRQRNRRPGRKKHV